VWLRDSLGILSGATLRKKARDWCYDSISVSRGD
jgi:hypothetical protein